MQYTEQSIAQALRSAASHLAGINVLCTCLRCHERQQPRAGTNVQHGGITPRLCDCSADRLGVFAVLAIGRGRFAHQKNNGQTALQIAHNLG